MRFSGKVALVTGATGGIGQAIVKKLRSGGATVVTTDREGADFCGDLMEAGFCNALLRGDENTRTARYPDQ